MNIISDRDRQKELSMTGKAEKIAGDLRGRIAGMKPGDKLPSEAEVARRFGVARMTAARALDLLVSWSLAERIPGRGTFVSRQSRKVIRIAGGNSTYTQVMLSLLSEHYPHFDFQIEEVENADLIKIVTCFPLPYEPLLMPLPDEMLDRIRRADRLFPFVFELHRRNEQIYSLPSFFAPVAIAWNRDLMRRIDPAFEPLTLTPERFPVLCRMAQEKGFHGFTGDFTRLLVSNALTCAAAVRNDEAFIERALELIFSWFEYFDSEAAFRKGDTLFSFVPRNYLEKYMRTGINFDLAPFPAFFGQRIPPIISEGLAVSPKAADRTQLFEICEYTLSAEYQRKQTGIFSGLSPDRAETASLMQVCSFRDDFYFVGLDRILNQRQFFSADFCREEIRLLSLMQLGRISPDECRRRILEEYRSSIREADDNRQLMNNLHKLSQKQ